MKSDRSTAIAVGVLFIAAIVASILGSVALGSALDGPDYLVHLADQQGRVILAVLLFLVAASSAFATAFLLFPILRRHAEGLAVGYVGLRAFENVFYVAGTVALLVMLTVSQSDAVGTAELSVLGVSLRATNHWSVLIGVLLFFGLGSVTLNVVLYGSQLVPRWLSGWGVGGAVLVLIYGLVGILGWSTDLGSALMLLAMPILLQELVFAVWLIARGFQRSDTELSGTPQPPVDAMA